MDNQNNFIERRNNINDLPNHAQIQNVQEITNVQQAFIDSIGPFINTSAFENARIIVQGLDSVIATYRPGIEQVQIAFDSMSQTINSLVENIDFERIFNITESAYLTVNALSESLNAFYETNYAAIAKTLANSLDSITLINFESLENILSEYSEADSFSEVEKEQLLDATEFVSYQFIQTSHNFEQKTDFFTSADINQANQTNYDTNSQLNELNGSKNENHSPKVVLQSESPSLIKTIFNRQNFYNDIASVIHTFFIMESFNFMAGNITLDSFLEIITFLVNIFM